MWDPILDALDPWRELTPAELGACYVPRPDDVPSDRLAWLLRAPGKARGKFLVCGARGAGKSTELTRLISLVHQKYVVVKLDAGLGLPKQAATPALLALLGAAVLRVGQHWQAPDADMADLVKAAKGKPLGAAAGALVDALGKLGVVGEGIGELLRSVGTLVLPLDATTGAALTSAGTVIETTAQRGAAALKAGDRLKLLLQRDTFTRPVDPQNPGPAQALVDALNQGLAMLAKAAGRPPLLLAEGLDKIETLEGARAALADLELINQLDAPLVLSGPIQLRHHLDARRQSGGLEVIPIHNVPVRKRDGSESAAGVAWLRQVFDKRMTAIGRSPDCFAPGTVERAAALSGGLMRDFLRLLTLAAERSAMAGLNRVDAAQMDAALREVRLERQGFLHQDALRLLRRILDERTLPTTGEADRLLYHNFVVCYANGDLWYRPHELLVDYLQSLPSP